MSGIIGKLNPNATEVTPTFKVQLEKTSIKTYSLYIKASNAEEAKRIALSIAPTFSWDGLLENRVTFRSLAADEIVRGS